MINQNQIDEFELLGFKLTESFHRGIYGWQVFKSTQFALNIVYDKCYYEAFIYTNDSIKFGGTLLNIIRQVLDDDKYFEKELSEISRPNRMSPKNVLKIIEQSLPILNKGINEK